MTLQIATIPNSVAALSVSGVTILDVDQIPPDGTRVTPVMYPEPLNFVTNFTTSRNSFGATGAFKTIEYDLNYTFLFTPIGAGRTGLDFYDDMLTKVGLIVDAVLGLSGDKLTGAWNFTAQGISDFGPVPDPAGNIYLGCKLIFHVIEEL